MNTTENNKLIAEFMGFYCELPEEDSCIFETPYMVNISDKEDWNTDENDWTSCLRADELLFHSSWDWLMSVVEKIESLGYPTNIFIEGATIEDANTGEQIVLVNGENSLGKKRDNCYKAVVEFIKWYNENK